MADLAEGGGGDDSSANASPLLSGIGEDISTSQGSPAASSAMAAAAALAANNAAEAKALAVAGLAGPGEGGRGGGGGGVGGTELSGNTPVAIISEQVVRLGQQAGRRLLAQAGNKSARFHCSLISDTRTHSTLL